MQRLTEIDRAKGLAIFLVVLGHITTSGSAPLGHQWFERIVYVIYSFHMPFFMYLSGFVMLYTYSGLSSSKQYFEYISSRFKRLAPGFLLFAVIILIGKLVTSHALQVDNVPLGFWQGLRDIMLVPSESAAKTLWFVYVLFEFYVLFPILLFITKGRTLPLVALGFAIHFIPMTPYLMIDWVFEYMVYFAIGTYFAANFDTIQLQLDRFRVVFLIAFPLSFALLYFDVSYPTARLVIGCLSIPALHALMRTSYFKDSSLLLSWGLLSYSVYLMNTIVIGFVKGVILNFQSWDGLPFLWIGPLLLAIGLYGPIFIKQRVFPYFPYLNRITS
jgi:fucose 4-O-acetylase-like acetyltransferase